MARAANGPSAGFPIAIERAIVRGITGSMVSPPRSTRFTMSEQPDACAPYIRIGRGPATRLASASS